MTEYGWTEDMITKALAVGQGALGLNAAKIPLVHGSYIIPPYIKRNGQVYRLIKEGRTKPYQKVIRIRKGSGSKYAFIPTDYVPKEQEEEVERQTEAYDHSMTPESSMYQQIQQLIFAGQDLKELEEDEEEILDIEFSVSDKPVNSFLKELQRQITTGDSKDVVAQSYDAFLRRVEHHSEKTKEVVKSLRSLLTSGLETETDVEKAEGYAKYLIYNTEFSRHRVPLVAAHVHALMQYKILTYDTATKPFEMTLLFNAIQHAHKLLSYNFYVHTPRSKEHEDPISYARSLIVEPLIRKAVQTQVVINENEEYQKHFSCYQKSDDINFAVLPGFSKEAGWVVNNFFHEDDGPITIKLDGNIINVFEHPVFRCGYEGATYAKHIELINNNGTCMVIDFGCPSPESPREPVLVPVQNRKSMSTDSFVHKLSNIFAGSYFTLADFSTSLETLVTKNNFIRVNNKKRSSSHTFNLTYSRKHVPTHRGELNQLYVGRIHKSKEKDDITSWPSHYETMQKRLYSQRDELLEQIKLIQKNYQHKDHDYDIKQLKALAALVPAASTLEMTSKPSPADFNYHYVKYYYGFSNLLRDANKEEHVKQYMKSVGYAETSLSQLLAGLQKLYLSSHVRNSAFAPTHKSNVHLTSTKTQHMKKFDHHMAQEISKMLADMFDWNNDELPETSLAQTINSYYNHEAEASINTEAIAQSVDKELSKTFAEILRKQSSVWKTLFEEITKTKYETEVLYEIANSVLKSESAEKIIANYAKLLSIGVYLRNLINDERVYVHVVNSKTGEKETSSVGIEKFVSLLIGSSNEDDSHIVVSKYISNETELRVLNSKHSSDTATGSNDYGIDIITLNRTLTESGQVSHFATLRTDSFSFKTNPYAMAVSYPYAYNVSEMADVTSENMIRVLSQAASTIKIDDIYVERGTYTFVGIQRSPQKTKTYAYVVQEKSEQQMKENIYGEDFGQRSIVLETEPPKSNEEKIPILNSAYRFDSCIVPEKYLIMVMFQEDAFLQDFAEEYGRSLAKMAKRDPTIKIKSIASVIRHPLFGGQGYFAFLEELNNA